ncbi:MAG: DUF1285 domain-containing protein [Candidatus Sericytochromatia bacterium]|nr:DUF1285 domain-containing protein [Candidatus Sericytochromatia bacterium]
MQNGNGTSPNGHKSIEKEPYTLAIDRDGIWTYNGLPLIHPKGLAMFKDHLQRADDGQYFVKFGPITGPVVVADFPYVARLLSATEDGLVVQWNTPPGETISPDHLFHTPEGTVGIRVRQGALPAKFDRVSGARLGDLLDADVDGTVWYRGPGRHVPVACAEF